MSDVTLMTQVVAANPTDATARLILADAVQEAGDEAAAVAIRREVEALALRARVVKNNPYFSASIVFTLGTAKASKGYGARQAEGYLTAHPEVLVYVYHSTAITQTGLSKDKTGPIMYHRKSSGSKWSGSVQMHRVSL